MAVGDARTSRAPSTQPRAGRAREDRHGAGAPGARCLGSSASDTARGLTLEGAGFLLCEEQSSSGTPICVLRELRVPALPK